MKIIYPSDSSYGDFILSAYGSFENSNVGLDDGQQTCKTLTFQVTEDCNLRCSYCYQICKTKNRMSFETAKKLVDELFNKDSKIERYFHTSNLLALTIEFIGGEPFLEVELIDKIMDYFLFKAVSVKSILAYNYKISISSNGTLYFDPKVQRFIKKWRPKLSLNISLDGCKELHDSCRLFPNGEGSYDLVEKAIKTELKINSNMTTKMTLAPTNIEYFLLAIKNLIHLGYKEIYCNCVFEDQWKLADAIKFYPILINAADYLLEFNEIPYVSFFDCTIGHSLSEEENSNWCGGNGKMLSYDYNGDFFPCIRYMKSSLGDSVPPYIIGNIERGILNDKQSCDRVNCLQCITRRSQSTDECFYCSIASGCAWCSAYNYQVFGTPNARATFICIMHKVRVLANCYFWNKFYRLNNQKERFKLNLDDESCLQIIDEKQLSLLRELESDL